MISNPEVAAFLLEASRLLGEQGANPYRVEAYRRAATLLLSMERPVAELLHAEGVAGLDRLPGIGSGLAQAIREIVVTGRLPLLERLHGAVDPVALLSSVPGIGRVTAERLHLELGIDTLDDLEAAANNGRLTQRAGLGDKRLTGIRECLAQRLHRRPGGLEAGGEAPVAELLEVDREYRMKAAAGLLPRITPRSLNPGHEGWLPVLHTQRGDRHYTALFSNTPRAHQLGTTHDWVILYYDGGQQERQCTIITSRFGPLAGRRIVRGREAECAQYYEPRGPELAESRG